MFKPRYCLNIAKVGVTHQSINQSIDWIDLMILNIYIIIYKIYVTNIFKEEFYSRLVKKWFNTRLLHGFHDFTVYLILFLLVINNHKGRLLSSQKMTIIPIDTMVEYIYIYIYIYIGLWLISSDGCYRLTDPFARNCK